MSVRILLTLFLSQALLADLVAKVIFVDQDANGADTGSSWADAYVDLQDALAGAGPGAEIWVSEGFYVPGRGVADSFVLANGISLYGGFQGGEHARVQARPDLNLTILSGDIGRDDHYAETAGITKTPDDQDGSNATNVLLAENSPPLNTNTIVLNGFIVSGGNGVGDVSVNGGGLRAEYVTIRLENMVFEGNEALFGGAFYSIYSDVEIVDCTFEGNRADSGGAVRGRLSAHLTVSGSTFRGNRAAVSGGALEARSTDNLIVDTLFEDNTANVGGALYAGDFYSDSVTIIGCDFLSNVANLRGGALACFRVPEMTMVNCRVQGNHAGIIGGGILFEFFDEGLSAQHLLVNTVIAGNDAGEEGGGLHFDSSTGDLASKLVHCTLTGNSAADTGGAIRSRGASLTLENTIIWRNAANGQIDTQEATSSFFQDPPVVRPSAAFAHCILPYEVPVDESNIDLGGNQVSDPRFNTPIDPLAAPSTAGDFSLPTDSPAADSGTNARLPQDTFDLDDDADTGEPLPLDLAGAPRQPNAVVDIGAYETQGPFPLAEADAFVVPENTVSLLDVLQNDAEGQSIRIIAQPSRGKVNALADRVEFVPSEDFHGSLTFTYFYKDKSGIGSNAATVNLAVKDRANNAPTFHASTLRTGPGTGRSVTLPWATDVFTDAGNYETGQRLGFDLSVISSDFVFAAAPTADTSGKLTFAARDGAQGIALIEATLSDSGPGRPSTTKRFLLTLNAPLIHHVDEDASGTGTGYDWANAFNTLGEALDDAIDGDEIWVAEGVYRPGSNRDDVFALVDGVDVYGGFAGGETSLGQRDPDLHPTILSGDLAGDDLDPEADGITASADDIRGLNAWRLVEAIEVDGSPIFDGFVLTAAQRISPEVSGNGAAFFLSGSSPFLRRCKIIGNEALSGGAAAFVTDGANPLFIDCEIAHNRTRSIGFAGIKLEDASSLVTVRGTEFRANTTTSTINQIGLALSSGGGTLRIEDCRFLDHPGGAVQIAGDSGSTSEVTGSYFGNNVDRGLIVVTGAEVFIDDCVFEGNRSDRGGALYVGGATVAILDSLFIANQADETGGAIHVTQSADVSVANGTFTGNEALTVGGAIHHDASTFDISNTIVYGNHAASNDLPSHSSISGNNPVSATARHSIIEHSGGSGAAWAGGMNLADGGQNLDVDPLFLYPEGGIYRLGPGSPGLDGGLNTANATATDVRGDARIAGGTIDIGSHEGEAARVFANFFPHLSPDGDENANGFSNRTDYAYGYHPASPGTLPRLDFYEEDGSWFLRYTLWPGTADAEGVLKKSPDLNKWIPLSPSELDEVSTLTVAPNRIEQTFEVLSAALPGFEDALFLRRELP